MTAHAIVIPRRQFRDPINRLRYACEPQGDDLVVHVWIEPGGRIPPHAHPRQVERWWVVAGRVRFRLGDTTHVVGPEDGETVVGADVKHALAGEIGEEAQLRCHVSPALYRRSLLEESAAAARNGLFTRTGLPRGMKGARWAARFLERHREETVFFWPPPIVQRLVVRLFGTAEVES